MSTVRFGIVQQSNVVARASRRTPAAEPPRPAVVPMALHGPRLVLTTVWVTVFATAVATAEPPEIAHVHPDYPTAGPRIVTGEGFPPAAELDVRPCWRPPESKEEVEAGLEAWRRGTPPAWPVEPPSDATRVQVFDSEPRVPSQP